MYTIHRMVNASRPSPSPVGSHGSAEGIRESLEQDILLGQIDGGTRLDEQRLALRFGTSRTPVREALRLLTATRLVERVPNRGTFVRVPTVAELFGMFEVMAELEALCARLAARRLDTDGLARLERAVTDCERAATGGDSDHYYRENERLHATLYALSGNAFLETEALALHRRLQAFRRLQLRAPRRVAESMAEHRGILDALRAGDDELAAHRARAHVAVQEERFGELVSLRGGTARAGPTSSRAGSVRRPGACDVGEVEQAKGVANDDEARGVAAGD